MNANEIIAAAQAIKNETGVDKNTAAKVGSLLENIGNEIITKEDEQTVSAKKTFTVSPVVPNATTDTQAQSKAGVELQITARVKGITGTSETDWMSQKAVTDEKNKLVAARFIQLGCTNRNAFFVSSKAYQVAEAIQRISVYVDDSIADDADIRIYGVFNDSGNPETTIVIKDFNTGLDHLVLLKRTSGVNSGIVELSAASTSGKISATATVNLDAIPFGFNFYQDNETASAKIDFHRKSEKTKELTLFVASSICSDSVKAAANYVCDGTNDNVQINQAIQALPETGGRIRLSEGLFNIGASILVDRPIVLEGAGSGLAGRAQGNMYGQTEGMTTIRATSAVEGIVVQNVASKMRGIRFSDFLLQGFGKGASNNIGLKVTTETDLMKIHGIDITDCYLGAFIKDADAMSIVASSFQYNKIGMLVTGALYPNISHACFADNDGVSAVGVDGVTYDTKTGGLAIATYHGTVSDSTFVRNDTAGVPYNSLTVMKSNYLKILGNSINDQNGNGIGLIGGDGSNFSDITIIANNAISTFGKTKTALNRNGIYISKNRVAEIFGNHIGSALGGDTGLYAVYENIYPNTWTGETKVFNNFFYGLQSKVKCYLEGYRSVARDNEEILGKASKVIAYFGTSIPEQGAGTSYPQLMANALNLTLYNESLGSSMVRAANYLGTIKGMYYEPVLRSLSMTIAEKQAILDNWTSGLNSDGVVTPGGTYGWRDLLLGSPPANYTSYASAETILSWSYENKLVAKYLDTTHEDFVESPDIFVFDHGHNDLVVWNYDQDGANNGDTNAIAIPNPVNSRNRFCGAMNYLIDIILSYNPRAVIVFVGHYENDRKTRIYQAQQNIAAYRNYPLLKLWEVLGFTQKTITTTGYWSNSTTWNQSGGAPTSRTMTQIWMYDDLHPATLAARQHIASKLIGFFKAL
jgi:hypothetical protein